jgi:ApaG protein
MKRKRCGGSSRETLADAEQNSADHALFPAPLTPNALYWPPEFVLVPSQLSRNIRVSVETKYTPERSQTARGVYSFQYNIQIKNEGSKTVQLISRHWVITDAHGEVEEVRGPGVVGKQPILRPGESFEYASRCPLRTPFGSMYGTYQMTSSDGEEFDVEIPAFALRDPKNMQ